MKYLHPDTCRIDDPEVADDELAILKIVVDGEEIIAYGLHGAIRKASCFLQGAWRADRTPSLYTLRGDGWEVLMWEILIESRPKAAALDVSIRTTLFRLIHSGCRVAWIGAEGLSFCDPYLGWTADYGQDSGERLDYIRSRTHVEFGL
ncbi:MAG: hypothetical protein FWH11_02785 [Micrococcales bacterium]|nr:hypothetical protein [Micrococcales bacterium]